MAFISNGLIFKKNNWFDSDGTKTVPCNCSHCLTNALTIPVLRAGQNSTVRLMIYLQEVIAEDFCFLRSVGEKGQQRAQWLALTDNDST